MELFYVFDLVGTFFFAVSGVLSASRKRLDPFGILFVAAVTAIGGGTLRDLAMGSLPVVWLRDANYLFVILLAYIASLIFYRRLLQMKRALLFFDTMGIALFTILGLQKGLDHHLPALAAVSMGLVSAVVGGMTRDVLCNDIPMIFKREIYATACLFGAVVYIVLFYGLGLSEAWTSLISMALIAGVRFCSVYLNWSLPNPFSRHWHYDGE